MCKFRIGLVEDDNIQVNDIKRVFYRYGKLNSCNIEVQNFFSTECANVIDEIVHRIIDAIKENSIDCVLIDYKLNFDNETNKGIHILKVIKNLVSEFPCVMLTVRPDECMDEVKIDPDKIYTKKEFLKIGTPESAHMINKILNNIRRVQITKENIIDKLNIKREKLRNSNTRNEKDESAIIEEIIKLEAELDKYCFMGQSELDKVYDATSLENIVNLIQKAKGLLD